MIQLRPCTPQQETEPLSVLVSVSFQKPENSVKSTLLWKYQKAQSFSAIAVVGQQTYVAFYSNLRSDLAWVNQEVSACLCLDMCTHPGYRGQGLVTKTSQLVYPAVVNAGIALSYGFSNEQGVRVDKHAHNYGYQVVGQLCSYTLVPRSLHKSCFNPITSIPVDIKHQVPLLHVAKPAPFMQWRYQQKPHAQYQILSLKDDPLMVVVLQCHDRQCHIVDLIGDFSNVRAIAQFLGKVVAFCFYTWHRPVSISVLPNRWWQLIIEQRSIVAIHTRSVPYYLTVKPHSQTFPADPLDPNNWWVTGGDIL